MDMVWPKLILHSQVYWGLESSSKWRKKKLEKRGNTGSCRHTWDPKNIVHGRTHLYSIRGGTWGAVSRGYISALAVHPHFKKKDAFFFSLSLTVFTAPPFPFPPPPSLCFWWGIVVSAAKRSDSHGEWSWKWFEKTSAVKAKTYFYPALTLL